MQNEVTRARTHRGLARLGVAGVAVAAVVSAGGFALAADQPAQQPAAAAAAATVQPSLFVGITPTRILDTRPLPGSAPGGPVPAGATPLGQGTTRDLVVAGGTTSVPANATAVALNVTVDQDATLKSFLSVWPSGEPRPFTSIINAEPGTVQANSVSVKVGANGSISLFNQQGTVNVVVDIVGYYVPGATVPTATRNTTASTLAIGAAGAFGADVTTASLTGLASGDYHLHAVVTAEPAAGLPNPGTLECNFSADPAVKFSADVPASASPAPTVSLSLDDVAAGIAGSDVVCRAKGDVGDPASATAVTVTQVSITAQPVTINTPAAPSATTTSTTAH
jgi:hypothetical protein